VLVAIGGLMLWGVLRKGVPRGARPAGAPAMLVVEPGPVALKPASTPAVRFTRALFAAGFSNAIVWLALRWVAFGSGGGAFHWVLRAMFVFFAAFGAYLAFAAARALVALAAPRVRVTASARQLRLGERLSVEWTFRGNNETISGVAVALVGSEIARVQRGDGDGGRSTQRQVRPFARFPVANAAGTGSANGTGTVIVPQNTVPTFSAPNNEIAWAVVVEASLRHLPDLREAFSVILLPEAR
jgi:hypothetical protein